MVSVFDTLGYAKRLRDGGVPPDHAEAHAEAARDFIMIELVTKGDLDGRVDSAVALINGRFEQVNARFELLESRIDKLGLQLTVRLGAMIAAGVALLAAIQKLS